MTMIKFLVVFLLISSARKSFERTNEHFSSIERLSSFRRWAVVDARARRKRRQLSSYYGSGSYPYSNSYYGSSNYNPAGSYYGGSYPNSNYGTGSYYSGGGSLYGGGMNQYGQYPYNSSKCRISLSLSSSLSSIPSVRSQQPKSLRFKLSISLWFKFKLHVPESRQHLR